MKNAINYFYNFKIDNIRMINKDYYFSFEQKNYLFQNIKDTFLDYKALNELNNNLIFANRSFFQIVPNKDNNIITIIAENNYILMLDNSLEDREFDFYDLLETNISIDITKHMNSLIRTNWDELWKNKIDYFEMYVNQNINKRKIINKYINYFIGLSENAISYVTKLNSGKMENNYDKLVVSHKRINDNKSLKQLYNPLYLVIDYPSRDISEYLKMVFFENKDIDISKYIDTIKLTNYGAGLIIARMLFPSFFFDLLENFFEDKNIEKEIIVMADKMFYYEKYLFKIYNLLKEKYDIPEINWLKKVDYSSTLTTPKTSGTSFTNIDSMPSLSVTSIMLQ